MNDNDPTPPPPVAREFTVEETLALRDELERILAVDPTIDRDTAWQTLLLLREPPIERLRRSLLRGRGLRANKL